MNVGHTMKPESLPSGLGKPVRPLIRILAALIGLVCLISLGLSAFLFFVGAPDIRLETKTVVDLCLSALVAVYAIGIAVSGKAPKGIWPWK